MRHTILVCRLVAPLLFLEMVSVVSAQDKSLPAPIRSRQSGASASVGYTAPIRQGDSGARRAAATPDLEPEQFEFNVTIIDLRGDAKN